MSLCGVEILGEYVVKDKMIIGLVVIWDGDIDEGNKIRFWKDLQMVK